PPDTSRTRCGSSMPNPIGVPKGSTRTEYGKRPVDKVRVVVRQPDDAGVLAEPRVLSASEATGGGHGPLEGFLLRPLTVEEAQDLRVAEGPTGGEPVTQPGPLQTAHFVDEPVGPHAFHPPPNPLVEHRARHVQS